ncbi:MAG: DUF4890 domain-containing protein [Prevotella sp.]|nr:DUF4890 domain-containing protein [Prevotella sp.]MBR7055024.1 DUF4890 domain-containing protein [Prevotella sp.]
MKKVLMIALMAASVSLTAMAQEQNSQEGRRFDRSEMIQRRTDMMAQRYGLNESQKMQLLELNKKYDMMSMGPRQGGRPGHFQGNNGEARGNAGEGQRQHRQGPPPTDNAQAGQGQPRGPRQGMGRGPGRFDPEKMKEYEAGLKSIMNDEQFAKYEADKQQRGQRRPPREANRENVEKK